LLPWQIDTKGAPVPQPPHLGPDLSRALVCDRFETTGTGQEMHVAIPLMDEASGGRKARMTGCAELLEIRAKTVIPIKPAA
jgi:hypothetical protein